MWAPAPGSRPPLRIVCPGMRLTLVEATRKKVEFLEHITRKLGLRDVEILWGRAEDLAHRPGYREAYDWAIARALADMPTLVEYLLPFVRVRGAIAGPEGENAPAEVHSAEEAIRILGERCGKLDRVGPARSGGDPLSGSGGQASLHARQVSPAARDARKRPLGIPPVRLQKG